MFPIITGRSRRPLPFVWGATLLAGLAIASASCDKVPLLAPGGSTITLSTNSTVVQSNGTAEIRATVLESSGTPVQNGTTVTFSTNLGAVSPVDARTTNGVATAQFIANGQSGNAEIRAVSGAAKPDTTSPLKLTVGAAAVTAISISASPTKLGSSGGSSQITATVRDTNGNGLAGVPVTFTTDQGTVSPSIVSTNSSGQATTTLTTTRDAKVTANAGGTATATVTVSLSATNSVTFGTPSPTSPTAGQTVSIPLTITAVTGADPFTSMVVNFGDGQSRDLGPVNSSTSVAHTFTSDGVYTLTATGTTASGGSTQAVTQLSVGSRVPISVNVSPATGSTTTTTTYTATASPSTNISGYTWQFDSETAFTTSGNQTSKRFTSAGTHTLTVSVTTTDGNSGSTKTDISVP